MPTVIHRFDSVEAFPVIGSLSSAGAAVETSLAGAGESAHLVVKIARRVGTTGPLDVGIALPPRAVIGVVERLTLDVVMGHGVCRIGLDIEDGTTGPQRLTFDAADLRGLGSCTIDLQDRAVRTVQCHRITIMMDELCDAVRLGLVALSFSGDARIGPAEMAG